MKRFKIVELEDAGREAEWQAYVERALHASLYHALQWRDILLRAFGHRSWYLMAQDRFEFWPPREGAKGREIRSRIFGGSGRTVRRVLSRVQPEYAGFGNARFQSGIFSERAPVRERCGDIARAPARTAGGRSNRT